MRPQNGKRDKSYKHMCSQIAWTGGFLLEDDGEAVYRDGKKLAEGEDRWWRVYVMLMRTETKPEWNWCKIAKIPGTHRCID